MSRLWVCVACRRSGLEMNCGRVILIRVHIEYPIPLLGYGDIRYIYRKGVLCDFRLFGLLLL